MGLVEIAIIILYMSSIVIVLYYVVEDESKSGYLCLLLPFMFGPLGLLLYLVFFRRKTLRDGVRVNE